MLGVFSAMEHSTSTTLQCKQERWQARTLASNRQAKVIKASHGPTVSPQSQEEEKVKKTTEKSKRNKGAIQISKGSGNGKTPKTGTSSLENLIDIRNQLG